MPDLHFEHPRLAALYDTGGGWSADRDFYLELAGPAPERILDLGCGTGLLATAHAARGHVLTGVDPAPAMLAVARARPHGDRVEWVEATAQGFRSPKRFDLVIMTGRAFQVLLTAEEVRAACLSMPEHLVGGGRVVLETRNPPIDWAAPWDGWEERREAGGVPVAVSYRCAPMVGQRLRFETHYAFPRRAARVHERACVPASRAGRGAPLRRRALGGQRARRLGRLALRPGALARDDLHGSPRRSVTRASHGRPRVSRMAQRRSPGRPRATS